MTEQEERERYRYLQLKAKAAAAQKVTPPPSEAETPGGDKSGILGAIARPLDYQGGLSRMAIAGALEKLTGKDLVKEGDLIEALKGNAPAGEKFLERAGVGEGRVSDYSQPGRQIAPGIFMESGEDLSRGGPLDPTLRGVAGFAIDAFTDPATYETGLFSLLGRGAKAANLGKVAKALSAAAKVEEPLRNPIGFAADALKSSGKAVYKSGLGAVDRMAAKYGKEAPSELLFKNRIWGTAGGIAEDAEKLADKLDIERMGILEKADQAGARADMGAAMAHAKQRVREIRRSGDPALQPIADQFEEQIAKYESLGAKPAETVTETIVSPVLDSNGKPIAKIIERVIPEQKAPNASTLSGFKSSLYDMIGPEGFNQAKLTNEGKGLLKKMGFGLKEATEKAVEKALPGEGTRLANVNADLGSLLTTRKAFAKEAATEAGKKAATQVDAMLLGLGHPGAYATKQAIKFTNSPLARTMMGIGLDTAGNVISQAATPVGEQLFRQLFMEGGGR